MMVTFLISPFDVVVVIEKEMKSKIVTINRIVVFTSSHLSIVPKECTF
jgi:hypothetical protein